MDVKTLIEELKKLPPQTELQEVRVKTSQYGTGTELTDVVWHGAHVTLEGN